jgi:ATP-dependent DNA helicase RecG
VVVELQARPADLEFLKLVLEQERRTGQTLTVEALLVLACLRDERRADVATIATTIQRDAAAARVVLERLVEAGIVQAASTSPSSPCATWNDSSDCDP